MSLKLLMAIMRVQLRFGLKKCCCNNFEPTEKMYELFNAEIIYGTDPTRSANSSTPGDIPVSSEDDYGDLDEALNFFHLEEDIFREEILFFSDEEVAEKVII